MAPSYGACSVHEKIGLYIFHPCQAVLFSIMKEKKEKKKADVNFSGKMGEKLTRKPSHITHTEEGCGVLCVASHH